MNDDNANASMVDKIGRPKVPLQEDHDTVEVSRPALVRVHAYVDDHMWPRNAFDRRSLREIESALKEDSEP